ncbi:MAG: flagellar M-ring protein FliF [Chloroflexi bacterium]|nr:flagellar M-ring protein FliF [Chloroflexota bacterium]
MEQEGQLGRLLGGWRQLSAVQRLTAAGFGLALVAGVFALLMWARAPELGVAFSNLRPEDAAAVTAKLKEQNIPFELSADGRVIRVPQARVPEVRLQMASQGLPAGGVVGFEVFNQQNFAMTDFSQRVNFQRALEGELTRTIAALDAVDQVRVHLALPQPSLFVQGAREPSGSVTLRLKPGRRLSADQIAGVRHLVASAVEGLKPENVTVVDSRGEVLSDTQEAAAERLTERQRAAQREVERELQQRAQQMLDQVLGPERAVARVRAELNWDRFETTREVLSPGGPGGQQVLRSSKEVNETFSGSPATTGGIPGTASNIPGVVGAQTGAQSAANWQRQETVTNFEVSKAVERLVRQPGDLKRLSVAVVVDSQTPNVAAQLAQIETSVSAALGINPDRGDAIQVSSIPFDRTRQEEEKRELEAQQRTDLLFNLAKLLVVVILAVVILMVVRSLLRRPAEAMMVPGVAGLAVAAPTALPAGVIAPELEAVFEEGAAMPTGPSPEETRIREIQAKAAEAAKRRAFLEEQVAGLAKSNPEAVADLIRTWMEQEAARS